MQLVLHTNTLFIIEICLLIGRCSDDVLTVSAQLDQMIQLLQLEISSGNNNSETRILDTILSDSDNILAQVNHHSEIFTLLSNWYFYVFRLSVGPKVFHVVNVKTS